jgi:histidine triad (HIT) family protein
MRKDIDCVFCAIAAGEIPAEILVENETCVAFLDAEPLAPGHMLVIPKFHALDILSAPAETVGDLLKLTKRVVAALKLVIQPDGFTIGINHGPAAGQAVPHLHLHIVPRFAGDGGKSIHGALANIESKPVSDIGQKIKDALKSLPD